jgi:hypothetical protein
MPSAYFCPIPLCTNALLEVGLCPAANGNGAICDQISKVLVSHVEEPIAGCVGVIGVY